MSKKTPKNAKAKIKSAPKRFIAYCLSFIVLLIILGFVRFNIAQNKSETEPPVQSVTCLSIRDECFMLEVADSDRERIKGLSDRQKLDENKGMLFVFDKPEEQCFWMKDVRFNLDIIWLNEEKKIIKIKENVPPDTYPSSFCATDTKYVLEFNRGFVSKYGLKSGSELQF